MIVSPFCASTSVDHSWLVASNSGHNISILWPSLHLCQDDAFAQKEPPHPLIVLCQVGEVPVIVSQHSTVEVCLCSLMVFFMPALLAGCICCTVLHLESFQNMRERE